MHPPEPGGKRTWLADSTIIFLLVSILIWPLYRMEFMANWASIEAVFIGQARFLLENGWTPGWQPNWYCGTRADYVYPPGLMYGTALVAKWMGVSTARGYHVFIALMYALGFLGIYSFARTLSRSRMYALIAVAVSATASPLYLFLPDVSGDAKLAHWLPSKLNVLVRYGEGPHMSAFALLMPAMAAAWWGLRRGRPGLLALCAILSAGVVTINFYGATALAMFFPLLVWALWITERDHWILVRAAAVAAISYGLTATWLTPSFVRITVRNLRYVAEGGNSWSLAVTVVLGLIYGIVSWRWARGRPDRAWPVFGGGSLAWAFVSVVGNYWLNFRVTGEPSRLMPELDLALVMGGAALGVWLWTHDSLRFSRWMARAGTAALILLFLFLSHRYVRRAWQVLPSDLNPQARIEFRVQDWVARNMPADRLYTTGSVRFWYNGWHDLPDVSGRAEQGLLNQNTVTSFYEIVSGNPPENSVLWLQALGASGVITHNRASQEVYHDFQKPEKFDGALEKLWDSGAGDAIYRVPRRYKALARVVSEPGPPEFASPDIVDFDALAAYVDWIEKGPAVEPIYTRESTDRIRVKAKTSERQGIVVQETFDPAWRAYSAHGESLKITQDPAGMMHIHTPPGEHDLLLVFELPLENLWGRVETALAVLAILALLIAARSGATPFGWLRRWWLPLGLCVVFLLNFGLNQYLFLPGESPYRESIEGGYASMARMIGEHPEPWGWNPLMYGGLPTQFLYLPAVPYLGAAASWLAGRDVATWVTAAAACLVPLTAAALVFFFTRSRGMAFGVALAISVISPGYELYKTLITDLGVVRIPWRFQLLVKYGEGPHNVGLLLLPVALIAMWKAATGNRSWQIAAAAIAMGAVTLTNWIGTMSLAWCGLAMVLSGLGTRTVTNFRLSRLAAAGLLGYLLVAFWLTPSFIQTTALNWPKDAYNYQAEFRKWLLLAGMLGGAIAIRLLFLRTSRRYAQCFFAIAAFGFGYLASVHYWFGIDTIPESRRYTMEFEYFLIILVAEFFRRMLASGHLQIQLAGLGLLVLAAGMYAEPVTGHALDAARALRPFPEEQSIEYRTAKYLESLRPEGRVYVTGGTRFRLNRWVDVAQLGGVFESGLHTRVPLDLAYKVKTGLQSKPGEEGRDALKLLQVAGIEYAVVHTPDSWEFYHDVKHPEQFDGLLPVVHDTGADKVYRVPFRGLARLVRHEELPARLAIGGNVKAADKLVEAINDESRPRLSVHWKSRDEIEIRGRIPIGMAVSIAVNYHPGWIASQDGAAIKISRDMTGFIVLDARPEENALIRLKFENVGEPRRAAGVSSIAAAVALGMLATGLRRRRTG